MSNDTRTTVLDVAQEFLQTRGINAFSFRDLADRVRIKSASVHYYFPTKGELCRALIAREREQVALAFGRIDAAGLDAPAKLVRYVAVFRDTLATGNRMCLCGMLAADFATLDLEIVRDLRASLLDHETWLAGVLAAGRGAGHLRFDGPERDEARSVLATLEGAMLLARAYEEPDRFDAAARRLLRTIGVEQGG